MSEKTPEVFMDLTRKMWRVVKSSKPSTNSSSVFQGPSRGTWRLDILRIRCLMKRELRHPNMVKNVRERARRNTNISEGRLTSKMFSSSLTPGVGNQWAGPYMAQR